MSTQKTNFINQAHKFYSDKPLAYCVDLWQKGENDSMIYNETEVPKGVLPHGHDHGGKPVFQKSVQDGWGVVQVKDPIDGGTLVNRTVGSHAVMAFMPAGFRDAPTPNKINPFREEIGNPQGSDPQKCASSLCHVVTTPVDICRYNIISCDSTDIDLIREMDRVGRQACLTLRDGPDDMVGSLRWHLKQDGTITLKDGSVVNTKMISSDFVDSTVFDTAQAEGIATINHLFEESLETSFHVGESASVGYLHSHTRPTCFDLTSRENMDQMASEQGYVKETSMSDCIEYLVSTEPGNLKDLKDSLNESDSDDDEIQSSVSELRVTESDEDDGDDGQSLTRQPSSLSHQASSR